MSYTPPKKIIDRYADVLVNFAANRLKGVKKGQVVMLTGSEVTKPLYLAVQNKIIEAGGHVIGRYHPDADENHNPNRDYFVKAEGHQLSFFPRKYYRGLMDTIDQSIYLFGETNKEELKGVDPKKIMKRGLAMKEFGEWRKEKENAGKFSWCLAMYGTKQMAEQVGMTEEEYWKEIIKACFLDKKDPVAEFRRVLGEMDVYRKKLSDITKKTEKFHIHGPDADLWITPGEKRKWIISEGHNVPSFEIFTSPDWRGTNGWIRFNQPLYRYGSIMEGIELWFEKGKVVKSKATKGEKLLKEMIATKNADKIGEWSLTDSRHSRITKPMGETLYDENMGGKYGNTHIAVGSSYHETYTGKQTDLSDKKFAKKLGYNDSTVHTDIISTTPRTVTAHLKNGKQIDVYKDGKFLFD